MMNLKRMYQVNDGNTEMTKEQNIDKLASSARDAKDVVAYLRKKYGDSILWD